MQIPSWDARIFVLKKAAESKTYCDEVAGVARENGVRDLGTRHSPAGPARGGASGLRRGFRRLRPEAYRRNPDGAPGVGGSSRCCSSAKASRNHGPQEQCGFSGGAGVALSLSAWPPRPAGLIEKALRSTGTRQALAPDLRCVRRRRLQRLLRAASGRRPVRWRDLRDVSGARGTTIRAAASTTTRRISCCNSWTTSSSSTSTTRASRRCTSRMRSSAPRADRACTRASSLGEPRGAFPVAGRWADRLRRHLLQDGAIQLRQLGRARVGVLPEAPRGRRGRGRANSSRRHIIRTTEKAFDDFAGAETDTQQLRRMLGLQPATTRRQKIGDSRKKTATDQRRRFHSTKETFHE